MNTTEYERNGGFAHELGIIRKIGQDVTFLQHISPTREHRPEELAALSQLRTALDQLREEIIKTRRTGQ